MNVLFLSSWFPNRTAPYNGDFVERHALAVSELCTTSVLHVVADDDPTCPRIEFTEIRKENLFEVIIYFKKSSGWIKPINRLINYLYYAFGYYKGYQKIKRMQGKPEIVHANIVYPVSVVAFILSRLQRIPYIISEHWTLFLTNSDGHNTFGSIVRFAAKNAYALVPVTSNLRDAMIRHGFKNNFRIVPNVVDTSLFTLRTPGSSLRKRFLHVSSMKEVQKNISGIIRTIRHLSDVRDDFVFTFAGEVQPHQIELAETLGLFPERVVFKGMLSNPEVAALMQESDILVMFSTSENLPCVILEALSCGLPVISSDVGGIKEWINETNGILVGSGDEDGLLKALIYMLDYHHNFDAEKLRAFAIEHFSRGKIAGQFLDIYRQALNHQKDV